MLGVSLTHLVESRDPFFLEAEIVGNIFQWDVLKICDRYKVMITCFMKAIRALTVQKILKIRILSRNSCKMKSLSRFLSNALIQIVLQEKIQPYIGWHHLYGLKHFISKKSVCLLLNSKR